MVEMKSLSTTVCLLVILFAESKSQSSTSSQTLLLGDDNSIYMPATSSYSDDNEMYGSGDDTESLTSSATSFSVQPSSTVMPSSYSSSTIFSSEMSMTFSLSDTSSTATPTAQFTSSPSSSPLSPSSSQFTQFSTTSTSMSATAQSSTTSTTTSATTQRGQQQANVAITLASPPMNQRDEFEADALRGLEAYYRTQMGDQTHFKSLFIANFMYWNYTNPAGQISTRVTVNYTVVLDNTTEAMGEFAEAHGELITSEHFTALGTNQVVLETTLLGETYSRSDVAGLKNVSCNIFENSINGCPADTDCEVEDDTTRCVPRNRGQQQANVAITLASPPMNQRDEFEADTLRGLQAYYRRQMGEHTHFKSLVVANFMYWNYTNPAGQISTRVTVNYTVFLDNTTEAMGEFAEAHGELITSEHFTALGTNQVVLETTLLGETYSRSGVTGLRDVSCNIFENSINGCPADTDCEVEDDTTRCVPRNRRDDWAFKVGLGVGIPLFALLCGIICCCCYICLARRRRRPVERDDESSIKSVFVLRRVIPVRFYSIGRNWPLYGSYYMESQPPSTTWPNPETRSVTDSDVSAEDSNDTEDDSTHSGFHFGEPQLGRRQL